MQSIRKSTRTAAKCSHIPNIFHPSNISIHLKEIIPLPILQKVQRRQQISCGGLEALPPFEMVNESQEEMSNCIRAIEYQLSISGQPLRLGSFVENHSQMKANSQEGSYNRDHIDVATKDSLEDEKEKMEWGEKIDEKKDLWSDTIFLEKLNNYLVAEDNYSEGEGFFIQCDGFLGE